jgi:twitching motility protein PilU
MKNGINGYLALMAQREASDLFLSAGSAPYLKIDGATKVMDGVALTASEIKALIDEMMSAEQRAAFKVNKEANFAMAIKDVARFRINVYYQRGEVAIAVRLIPSAIPALETLGLPPEIAQLAMIKRGLIVISGAGGSGKSTTMAAMVNHRAHCADDHILTIEDPIEFVFPRERSLVDQREVGIDTLSFGDAMKNAMRESPDVIMLGEIRDMETAQHAIAYAESGHLCITTMHANNANQVIERILNYFPAEAHKQVLLDLSLHLEAVISQRLVHGLDGKRAVAVELLLNSSYISEMIRQGRLNEIKHEMDMGNQEGAITLDHSLFNLYRAGKISRDEALHNADSHTDLALKIRLSEHHSVRDAPDFTFSVPNLDGSYN